MGGVFDPPHVGHLAVAHQAWWQLGLDEVRVTPVGSPPHRNETPLHSGDERADLVLAAIQDHSGLRLWREELDRSGPSYSADTVAVLARECPGAEIWFIMGADQLATFSQWRRPEAVIAGARLAVAPRPGVSVAEAETRAGAVVEGRVDWLDMPAIALSSTEIRSRIERGLPLRYLVPDGVERTLRASGRLLASARDGYPDGT